MPKPSKSRVKGRVIDSGDNLSKKMLLAYILILAAAGSLMPFTIDPFLPSFPQIADDLGVSSGTLQFTLTGVTLGFALGQLLAGPLSDALGRRRPLLMAMSVYVISAIALFMAPNVEVFFAFRVLMGMGAAAAAVLGQAIIRDLFSGMPMMKMLGRVYVLQSLAPVVAPIMGGQLIAFISWQQLFLVFSLAVLIILLVANQFLVETLPVARRRSNTPIGLLRGFKSVLRDRVFVGLLIFGSTQLTGLFAYLNVTPFLFQGTFGISPAGFGWWFAINSLASWLGVQVGSRLPALFSAQWLLVVYAASGVSVGLGLMLTTGSGFLAAELFFAAQLFIFGATLTSMQTLALLNHGSEAGTAASLLGVTNFTLTTVVSPLFLTLSVTSTFDIGVWLAAAYSIGLLSLIFVVQPWRVPDMRKA